MARTYNIGGAEKTLEEAKKLFPFGIHSFGKGNLFESITALDPMYPEVNINHGWKLHADLKKELSLEDAFASLGLRPRQVIDDSPAPVAPSYGGRPVIDVSRKGGSLGFDVVDRDLFDTFKRRFHTLTGGNASDVDEDYFDAVKRMISVTGNYDDALKNIASGEKYVNPMQLLEVIANLGQNDINYKMDHKYGTGRMFTFYGQSLEERDRIISAIEGSKIADSLEDVNDESFRYRIASVRRDVERKNTPVSEHLNARFTTDYINTDYVDDRGVPFWDLQEGSSDKRINSKPRIAAKIDSQGVSEAEAFKVSGQFEPYNADEEIAAIRRITQESPEMADILHGKAGYVSPYGTIEDIIEYRTGERVEIGRRSPVQVADLSEGSLPRIEPANYDEILENIPEGPSRISDAVAPATKNPDLERMADELNKRFNAPLKNIEPTNYDEILEKLGSGPTSIPKAAVQVEDVPKFNVAPEFLYDDDIAYSPTRMDEAIRQSDYINLWNDLLNEKDEKIRLEKLAQEQAERERVAAKQQQQRERLEERNRQKAEKKRTRRERRNQPEAAKPKREPVLKVGTPTQKPNQTASKVTKSGTGTPNRNAPQAAVKSKPRPSAAANTAANAAGGRGTTRATTTAANVGSANASSRAVVQGASGSKNLRVLGAAAVAGLLIGGHAMFGRTQQDNIDRRLEMQRKGIIS